MSNPKIFKQFYAVCSPNAIGIFTTWEKAKKLIIGQKNQNKKFKKYYHAYNYLCNRLSEKDFQSYGIEPGNKLQFDHIYWCNQYK